MGAPSGEVADVVSRYRAGRRVRRGGVACQVLDARAYREAPEGRLGLRLAKAGFAVVWLGGVTVLAWTYLAGLLPVYQGVLPVR